MPGRAISAAAGEMMASGGMSRPAARQARGARHGRVGILTLPSRDVTEGRDRVGEVTEGDSESRERSESGMGDDPPSTPLHGGGISHHPGKVREHRTSLKRHLRR